MKKIIVWFFSFLLIINCSIISVFATSTELDLEENIVEEYDTSEDFSVMLMSEGVTGTELKRKIVDTLVTYWLILNNYATELVVNGFEQVYNFADYIITTNYLFNDAQKKVFEMKADEVIANADNYDSVTSIVLDNQDMLDLQQAMAESNYQSSDIPVEDFIERGVTSVGNNYIKFVPFNIGILYNFGPVSHSNGIYRLFTSTGKPFTSYEKVIIDTGTIRQTFYYAFNETYSLYSDNIESDNFSYDLNLIDVDFGFITYESLLDWWGFLSGNVPELSSNELVLVAYAYYDSTFCFNSKVGYTNYVIFPMTYTSSNNLITKSDFMDAMTVDTITPPTHVIDSDITSVLPSVKESTTLTIPLDSSPDTSSMSDEEIKAYITSLLADSSDVDSGDTDTDSDSDNTETSTDTSSILSLLKSWSDSILSLPKRIGEVADSIADLPGIIVDSIVDVFVPDSGYWENAVDDVVTLWNSKEPDLSIFKDILTNFFNSIMGNTDPPEWYLPIPEELQQYMGTDKALIIDFSWFDKYKDILHSILTLVILVGFMLRLPKKLESRD